MLRYVQDDRPGIRRIRAGRGFRYVGAAGRPIRDARTLRRIQRLAIPPAYTDVWICPDPRGHVQATGRDSRGRKQYRYHARWREVRDELKFDRMLAFARALPRIRRRVRRDLARHGLPRAKVVAAIVQLLADTCIRVGNEEYARANRSYGLTTLRDSHVRVRGDDVRFEFRGKRGKLHRCRLRDRAMARVVARCQSLPGAELFQYVDGRGRRHSVGSADVNAYVRRASSDQFSAKDFRTWSGTMIAARALASAKAARSPSERRRAVLAALDEVAETLNNTRAVCRKYYVHPRLLEAFEDRGLPASFGSAGRWSKQGDLTALERAVVAFLFRPAARTKRRGAHTPR
jgi:DNA topoisomerase-1